MNWYDWCIVIVPLAFLLYMGVYSGRYMRGVVDFLAGGRVCGRYMLTASVDAQSMSVITVVAGIEVAYQTGYAMALWHHILIPITMILSLTGYAFYRFRETRSLSLGQFLEMRYNKVIRIYGATLRTFADILTNAIGPAITARFFIYFLDLPHRVSIFGWKVQTYQLILLVILCFALFIIWCGGQLSVNVTDTIQSLICYPLLIIFAIYFLLQFSWGSQVAPVLTSRVPGESFVNPYDVMNVRDFNIFALCVAIMSRFLNRGNYMGGGIHGSARTPHEQKMSGVLATWRHTVFGLFAFLVGILLVTVMNSKDYAPKAKTIRDNVVSRVADEIIENPEVRDTITAAAAAQPVQVFRPGATGAEAVAAPGTEVRTEPLSRKDNLDTTYLKQVHDQLLAAEQQHQQLDSTGVNANAKYQEFHTLYFQTSLPVMLKNTLPGGMLGLLCMIMVLMMISTDDSRILYNSMTIVQDIILPFRKKPLSPKQHILLLRILSLVVGGIFFFSANVLAQLDFINLFIHIVAAIWGGAAGPVIIGGLYTRFGTSFGAFCSLFFGGGFALCSALVQRFWASDIYPWLDVNGWAVPIGNFLSTISEPLNPLVVWEMNPVKFPINSVELLFIAMIISCSAYTIGSLLTKKESFNLEKMLHRGIYDDRPQESKFAPAKRRSIMSRFVSITPEYTRGDKIIAWSAFVWSLVWGFGITFIMVIVWNAITPWSIKWWTNWLLLTSVIVPVMVALVVACWFSIGAFCDLRRFFRDLSARGELDETDDGRVVK